MCMSDKTGFTVVENPLPLLVAGNNNFLYIHCRMPRKKQTCDLGFKFSGDSSDDSIASVRESKWWNQITFNLLQNLFVKKNNSEVKYDRSFYSNCAVTR